ncbi:MAG: hypothetical protein ACRC9P_09340 [Bacteroides sp.]
MGKNKKAMRARKEEMQAKKVMRTIFIVCILLAIVFIIAFSSM